MKNLKKILVAIDRSTMAEEALKRAISMAKEKNAQLIVIHVIEPYFIESPFIPSVNEAVRWCVVKLVFNCCNIS